VKIISRKQPAPTWRVVLEYVRSGRTIIGVDEVGRGAWAGPVVAAAVVLPPKLRLPGLADSKLLTPKSREQLSRTIKYRAVAVGIGWVQNTTVDRIGLTAAVRQASTLAIDCLGSDLVDPIVILDGKHNFLRETHDSVVFVKADARITPVAAASVIAKVARDHYMNLLDRRVPGYGFVVHKGYGTLSHRDALATLGPSAAHRVSWSPFSAPVIEE
jgi:ribonuclease HII